MKCYEHPDADAVATCVKCGRGICQDCAVDVSGKIQCKECLATGYGVTGQAVPGVPFNRMAAVSMGCSLGGWLLWLLICCFDYTVGTVLALGTLGVAYLCLIPLGFIPLVCWIAGVVAGHMGTKQISESAGAEGGREMALVGLISGYVGLGLTLCGCLVSLILVATGVGVPFISSLLQSLGG